MDIEDLIHELHHLKVPKKKMKHFKKAMKHLKKLIPEGRGQWITTDGLNLICDKCGMSSEKAYDICPSCGREMHKTVECRFLIDD